MNTVKHYLEFDLTRGEDLCACGCDHEKRSSIFKNTVFLTRGDNLSHELVVSLREGNMPYVITEGCSAYMYGVSEEGRILLEECAITDDGIRVIIASDMLPYEKSSVEFSLVGERGEMLRTPVVSIISLENDFDEETGKALRDNDSFTFLLESLEKAEASQITSVEIENGDLVVSFADGRSVNAGRVQGEAFTYRDFTSEQLEDLKGPEGKDGKSAYQYAKEAGYTGTEAEFAEKLAGDVPSALPNPHPLTINGISYDGSEAVDVTVTGGNVTDGEVKTETVLSDNLFDKTTAIIGKGWYHAPNGGATLLNGDSTIFYSYVPLRGSGTYRTVIWWSYHSEELAKKVPLLKEDNSFYGYADGTITKIDNTFAYLEFVVTVDMVENGAAIYAFDGANFGEYNLSKLMIVKNREYPSSYIPYGYIEVVVDSGSSNGGYNVLSGKTAVFLGDSICAGTTTLTDAVEYGYGWGGLIGSANSMKWKNFGKNGGTVTALSDVGTALWLKTQATTAKSQYPDTDYVIFEGGCNDGDKMGTSGLGTISADFSTFDESKFSGAFEALILQLLTDFPYAKIGYVIPPKMGIYNTDFSSRIYATYFERAKEICKKWGVPFVDLWNETPLNPCLPMHLDTSLSRDEANRAGKFYVDGQHLTLDGYKRISPQIEEWMRGL